jgi:hypothetical protein
VRPRREAWNGVTTQARKEGGVSTRENTQLLEEQKYKNSQARVGYVHKVVSALEWNQPLPQLFQLFEPQRLSYMSYVLPQVADFFK